MSNGLFEAKLKKANVDIKALTDTRVLRGAAGMRQPKLVVRPRNVEQLQVVQRTAQSDQVTLWVSPNASGNGLLALESESVPVLVDLSHLRSIISVNRDSAYALVEPGVSYRELNKFLRSKGYDFWLDSGRNEDDAIVGNIFDRSFGYTGYADNLMMQCGMEVVLPDGTLVRTGMGAFPNSGCWQLYKHGFGAYIDGSFSQSSFGIPSKMGLWISPASPAYRPFALRIDDAPTMVGAVEMVRNLRINMVVPNVMVVVDGDSERKMYGGDPAVWNIYGALYGLPKNVDFAWGIIKGAAAHVKGGRLEELPANAARATLMRGKPAPEWRRYVDGTGSRYLRLVFALPIEGEQALQFATRTHSAAQAAGCQIVIEQGTSWRALLAEVLISYEVGGLQRTLDFGRTLIRDWAGHGIGVVRADPVLRGEASATYSDPGFRKLQGLLGQAVGGAKRAA